MDDALSALEARRLADMEAEAMTIARRGIDYDVARPAVKSSPMVFQYRVLRALVLREMASVHGQSRLGYLMGIVTPLITLSVLVVAFSLRGRTVPADFSLGVFVVTGYPLWQGFI